MSKEDHERNMVTEKKSAHVMENTSSSRSGGNKPRCFFRHLLPPSCLPSFRGRSTTTLQDNAATLSLGSHSQNTNRHYGNGVEYWDARYLRDSCGSFDWYQRYSSLKTLINLHIPDKHARILMIGCGTSNLSEDMVLDGYTNIVNIDVSTVCINHLALKHKDIKALSYQVEDVCSMTFPDGYFDAAIDKGTLDTLMCEDCSWDSVLQMVLQVDRVLRPNGAFLEITYGEPSARFKWLEIPPTWSTSIFTLTKPATHHKLHEVHQPALNDNQPVREYTYQEAKEMEDASQLKNVHFVYVSRKVLIQDECEMDSSRELEQRRASNTQVDS
mmetsp:Transcript_44350/g.84822  ORF Transcript_44350/g.84822 Transcript_44350/m.84822 type:complete len:328 (+) Transcript_44350:564-1547(+)|eukprot:CAMPEP_0114259616 /NCGR_PEP_ID=MMETSP0058-20121206/19989_1 /TAXON_ID=36894 /ORGANISM="Pyramimonas parkeae, CCMP726" /LENGTH=327 /DNA_ID=CAMNT_0001374677 /DNA_START=485 /DNA_END=1468 /DNA_ORIENTATION=+